MMTADAASKIATQFQHILGINSHGHNLAEILVSLFGSPTEINLPTLFIGNASLFVLLCVRKYSRTLLVAIWLGDKGATIIARTGPIFAVAVGILTVATMGLDKQGVKVLDNVPQSLPPIEIPTFDAEIWMQLVASSALISLIGFVVSVLVGRILAAKKKKRIDPS